MRAARVRDAAKALGLLEEDAAIEWVRLVNGGMNSFQASKVIDAEYAVKLRLAEADYQIALRDKVEDGVYERQRWEGDDASQSGA